MPSSLAFIARFPRARLGHAPTPLDPAPNLGAVLGIDLWIKREDCTGLALGGNKVRQLEFHFGEAEGRVPRGRVAPSANLTDGERIVPYDLENQQYLGNGAYAGFDGYQVWVLTCDG